MIPSSNDVHAIDFITLIIVAAASTIDIAVLVFVDFRIVYIAEKVFFLDIVVFTCFGLKVIAELAFSVILAVKADSSLFTCIKAVVKGCFDFSVVSIGVVFRFLRDIESY